MATKNDNMNKAYDASAKVLKLGDCCYTRDQLVKMGLIYLAILVIAFII